MLKFQINCTVEVQLSVPEKYYYSIRGGAGDVLHERASSNKMKNIHCEVQVILLQKSLYIMRGSIVLVMYYMQSASKNKKMKNIDYEVQVILQWKFWYIIAGGAGVVFHKRATNK